MERWKMINQKTELNTKSSENNPVCDSKMMNMTIE